ncbi:MAG: addiction module protein [Candidatus Hydrogenedentes bacterium]|nr:addiction module protein [Candidatus Hydrogenedentota bacterium]
MSMPELNIDAMTVDDRLSLMEALWDSLSATPSALELAPEQQAELDRRVEEMDRDGVTGRDWEEIRDRLLNKSR